MKPEELRLIVKEKYGKIAAESNAGAKSSCCSEKSSCCSTTDYSVFSESYAQVNGYNPDADLNLGCGIPTEFAQIRPGDTVVDLGSGAGNDCFVARALVGDKGKVIGIDMTEAMIERARANVAKLNFTNVEFRFGDIEAMPLADNLADVIISNCVLNLVPDKRKAFGEIFRVLKPGAHLSVSDIVLRGELPEKLKQHAEIYAGCVSGAMQLNDYLGTIKDCGLVNIRVQKEKKISVPDQYLLRYMSRADVNEYRNSGAGIFSVTVYAEKPSFAGCGYGCNC